jgi:hypothetical protein
MRINKTVYFLSMVMFFIGIECSCNDVQLMENDETDVKFTDTIPTEGNSWVIDDLEKNKQIIKKGGIRNWSEKETRIRTYFKTTKTGELNVGIQTNSVFGSSEIKVTCGGKTKIVKIGNSEKELIFAGTFEIKEEGYNWIEIQGVEKSGDYFPEIKNLLIGGEATEGKVYFAKEDFYWGRRGPSVHLNYQLPENAGDVLYFYNEITIPDNNDVLGSYFMANGFGQGYFGMQVNSPTERRILFSVWSPYKTDNPGEIPEDQKIKILKKGEGVYTGEFGNEGSGGQSYYRFMWKAGTTYKFLLKGVPTGNGATDFTAWFFAPEENNWKLIASFRRPKTDTYLTRPHSFLENFYTETGNVTRKGLYSNQWIYNSNDQWLELTKIKFTADATARKESRMDYSGGADNQVFLLKNCGFFSNTTPIDSYFERKASGIPPVINFEILP